MVGQSVSASSTITSSSDGPRYLSSSETTAANNKAATRINVSLFMPSFQNIIYVLKMNLVKILQSSLFIKENGQKIKSSCSGVENIVQRVAQVLLILIQIIINILPQIMQVFLHFLDGTSSVIDIKSDTTLESLLESVGCANCRAVYQGAHLDSLDSLSSNSNIYLTADLDGGKKKKKKKVYTTKKKNKHIHKRVKMGIYSLYSVDGKGNVTQQRKTCPSCGPGTFMAQHWDRYYCGFCHTTIKMDAETVKKNEQIMKKKKAALEAEKKAKEKEAAQKAPAGKGKKDAKKGKKK